MEILAKKAEGATSILQLEKIPLIVQLSYSPELIMPIKHLWEYIRENYLHPNLAQGQGIR